MPFVLRPVCQEHSFAQLVGLLLNTEQRHQHYSVVGVREQWLFLAVASMKDIPLTYSLRMYVTARSKLVRGSPRLFAMHVYEKRRSV